MSNSKNYKEEYQRQLKKLNKDNLVIGNYYFAPLELTIYDPTKYVKPVYFNNSFRTSFDSILFEFWKPITKEVVPNITENRYMISSFGRTYDYWRESEISWNMSATTKFYVYLHFQTIDPITGKIGTVTKKLHRIEMQVFCYFPGCENYQVNHLDGMHNDNILLNLEWVTASQNRRHAILNGIEDTMFGKNCNINSRRSASDKRIA